VSAACLCVLVRFPSESSGGIDQSIVRVINDNIPNAIFLHDIRRAADSFNARNDCYCRHHEYVFHLELLKVHDVAVRYNVNSKGDPCVARLNRVLSRFVGTHCFANFTDYGIAIQRSDTWSRSILASHLYLLEVPDLAAPLNYTDKVLFCTRYGKCAA
jgi:tRNA pseudouridine(38-40) synthase